MFLLKFLVKSKVFTGGWNREVEGDLYAKRHEEKSRLLLKENRLLADKIDVVGELGRDYGDASDNRALIKSEICKKIDKLGERSAGEKFKNSLKIQL